MAKNLCPWCRIKRGWKRKDSDGQIANVLVCDECHKETNILHERHYYNPNKPKVGGTFGAK